MSLEPFIVEFPLGKAKNHRCWPCEAEVTDWQGNQKPRRFLEKIRVEEEAKDP